MAALPAERTDGSKHESQWSKSHEGRTLLDKVLLVVDDADILLGEILDRLVGNLPKLFGDLRNET